MSDTKLLVESKDGVTTVTLNQPEKRNALTPQMRLDIADILRGLMADPECGAIIITGAGGNFCSGADISHMKEVGALEGRDVLEIAARAIRIIVNGPKPVVAAVEGASAGAGLSLALACDFVVGASNAKFAAPFLNVGLMPDMGALYTVQQRIGAKRARQFFLSAETIDGATAHMIGLSDELCEPGQALAKAQDMAKRYAAMAPMAFGMTKQALAHGVGTLEEALRVETDYQPILRRSEDHKEAVKAFMEKRKPVFVGN